MRNDSLLIAVFAATMACRPDAGAPEQPDPPGPADDKVTCELVSCPEGECPVCPEVPAVEPPPGSAFEPEGPAQFRFEPVDPAPVLPVEGSASDTLALGVEAGRVVVEYRAGGGSPPDRISEPDWVVLAAGAVHGAGASAVCWTRLLSAGDTFAPPQDGNETLCRYRRGPTTAWGPSLVVPQRTLAGWVLGVRPAADGAFEIEMFEDPRGDLLYEWSPDDVSVRRWDGEVFGEPVVEPGAAGDWY